MHLKTYLFTGLIIIHFLISIPFNSGLNIEHESITNPQSNSILPDITPVPFPNSSVTFFDSVVIFKPNASNFVRNLNLTRNYIYQFIFEGYFPNTPFEISLNLTDPYGNQYRLIQNYINLTTNYTRYSVPYLCNENGFHFFELGITANSSLPVYISFKEFLNLSQYIRYYLEIPSQYIMVDEHAETFLINSAKKSQKFFFPLIPDIEYSIAYFRGVGIPDSIFKEINYTYPSVKIDLKFDGISLPLVTNLNTTNPYVIGTEFSLIKFAVWKYQVAQIEISTNASSLNLNYAFAVYSAKEIGDGPDEDPPPYFFDGPPIFNSSNLPSNTSDNNITIYNSTNLTNITENNVTHDNDSKNEYSEKNVLDFLNLENHLTDSRFYFITIIILIVAVTFPYLKKLKHLKIITIKEGS